MNKELKEQYAREIYKDTDCWTTKETYEYFAEVIYKNEQLQNQVEKLTQENNDLENSYILARDNLSKSLLENADLKERIGYLERSNNRKEETIIELRMEQELDKYKDIIDKAINQIEITIETIKQQPSKNIKDDEYLIVRLKSFINILGSKE